MGGAIIKLDATSGELAWSADVPSALGMAVAPGDGAVYAQIAGRDFTFGDTSFQSMGNADQYDSRVADPFFCRRRGDGATSTTAPRRSCDPVRLRRGVDASPPPL